VERSLTMLFETNGLLGERRLTERVELLGQKVLRGPLIPTTGANRGEEVGARITVVRGTRAENECPLIGSRNSSR